MSLPSGAKAGDLTLKPCTYGTEEGSYKADCGTLVVPENAAEPTGRLIALPVKRIRARSANPGEPIFRLQGGPGITNMDFTHASRFADGHDVVLVGYRGVDGSVELDCPEVESALRRSGDVLSERSLRAYADGYRSCADRLTGNGIDVTRYGIVQQVDDLEAARRALGYERIDLVSESAGTRTALIYGWRYPDSIHRSVMIGVNPPGHFMWDARTTDEQLALYAELCARDASCSTRTDDLAATVRQESADIPGRWFVFPIKKGNVRVVSLFGLFESTSEAAPANAPGVLDAWLSAAHGDDGGLWFASLAGDLLLPRLFVFGQYAAFGSIDVQAAREYWSGGAQGRESNLGYAASAQVWGGGRLADAWPAAAETEQYRQVRTSQVETLLIGGPLDFSTPPQNATRELLPSLPNGHQVVLPGFAHSLTFWEEQPDAGTRLINTFLDSGRVDDSLYQPQPVDFTPSFTNTAIAKIVAGAIVGLALLGLLLLLGLALRVHWGGAFGTKTGATLRSLYAIVLGLGGWCIGALIVLTTMTDVPLDDQLLATLAIGIPVGLGTYWAWRHRDWPARDRRLGLAVAGVGALAGAWLGFHASDLPLSPLTAIVGAVAGTNLPLILLDLTRARPAPDQHAPRISVDIHRRTSKPPTPTAPAARSR